MHERGREGPEYANGRSSMDGRHSHASSHVKQHVKWFMHTAMIPVYTGGPGQSHHTFITLSLSPIGKSLTMNRADTPSPMTWMSARARIVPAAKARKISVYALLEFLKLCNAQVVVMIMHQASVNSKIFSPRWPCCILVNSLPIAHRNEKRWNAPHTRGGEYHEDSSDADVQRVLQCHFGLVVGGYVVFAAHLDDLQEISKVALKAPRVLRDLRPVRY